MTLTTCQRPGAPAEVHTGSAVGGARMGPRLRAVLELCPAEGPVADIGSGHGRLALELKRRIPPRRVFATEISSGPSGELRRLLGPASGIEILEGEGLAPLEGLGCRGVVIAGLGGVTIAQILERDAAVARHLGWVCLQPAQRAERLQSWLEGAGWALRDHRQVVEKSHLYQLYLVTPP